MPRRCKMTFLDDIRNTDVSAIDLTAIDFTLQFAHQVGLPCKKGLNIRMMKRYEGVVDVSVLILDLGRKHDLFFCIQENPHEKTWEACCLYPVDLTFNGETPESDLPAGFKHENRFRAKRDETGKYKFNRSQ